MSQSAIGRAALILSLNNTALRQGLGAERQHAQRWADDTARSVRGRTAAGGAGWFSGIGAAAARVAGPIAAAAAGVMGVSQGLETIADVARGGAAARAFGLTAEQFTGMAGLTASVGGNQREFIESLVTLGKVAAEGAAGQGEVATAWFRSLNLDAQQFKAMRLDEQFFAVWEALQTIPEPAERVRALMVAFGEDGGKNLLPLLSRTPAEIRQMAASFAVSTAEVERATAANAAMTQASSTLNRAWRSVAVAAAPVVEKIATGIARMQPLFDWIGGAISTYADVYGAALGEVVGWVDRTVGSIRGWIAETFQVREVTFTVKDYIVGYFRVTGQAVAAVWDTLRAGAGVVAIVFGAFLEHGGAALSMLRRIADLGRELPDHLRPQGFERFADAVARADDRTRELGRGIREWGQGAVRGWGDSARQFNAWLDRVTTRQQEAARQTAAAAAAGAGQVAAAVAKMDNAALLRGSSAEVSARMRVEFGQSDPQRQMVEAQRAANQILGQVNDGVRALNDRIAALPGLGGV